VCADDKFAAFLELESAIRACSEFSEVTGNSLKPWGRDARSLREYALKDRGSSPMVASSGIE
jgi:hypothetical protein